MATGQARNPWLAGLLSSVLPGLGQFYNRQWWKGMGFLLGVAAPVVIMLSSVNLESLQRAAESGMPPDNIWLLFGLAILSLTIAIWSVADAARAAKKS
jgi:TM2 domain-containing membrane protein YozV